jgi:hypothetical protein
MGLAVFLFACAMVSWSRAEPALPAAIVCPRDAEYQERLAAKEIRRYVYLRTGVLLPVVREPGAKASIVVGSKNQPLVRRITTAAKLNAAVDGLGPEQYWLKTLPRESEGGGPAVLVVGGDPLGTLYGAYRLAEHLGVRFYLHGDVVPDEKIPLAMPQLDETGKPLMDRRGIQPFHDFPEGPDWWNIDGYKAVLGQLPKLRMNFFGLHTYPQGGVGPEPTVWIGPPQEIGPGGAVKASYPSRHFTTAGGAWGYRATKTGDYLFGAAALFDRDDYGADYMRGMTPWPKTPKDCNELFDRMGRLLAEVFQSAGRLGIKTCLGTETPLVIPTAVKERLKAAGKDPADPAVVQEVYEGIFRRIIETHPLDYYWFWTPEDWTQKPVSQQQIAATLLDLRAARAAAEKVKAPFTLATCGWVLGPVQDPAQFDRELPKSMPLSCINRNVGKAPVEPGFARVQGRPKWSIPWLEDDPAMILPQLWAGRMRRDAADSLAYGCTGLMGIHWRTRVLAPNVSALAKAAWEERGQGVGDRGESPPPRLSAVPASGGSGDRGESPRTASGGSGDRRQGDKETRRQGDAGEAPASGYPGVRAAAPRYLPVADFYADWARAEFGPEAAGPLAALFTKIDGELPRPADWVGGPGGIKPDSRPWSEVSPQYAFVDEMAALRERIRGGGNLERFDYWLNSFRYLRATGQICSAWAEFNAAMNAVRAEKEPDARKRLAREKALPLRKELVARAAEVHGCLLATVSTYGELGTVANWQQHLLPGLLAGPGRELAEALGEPLPEDAEPWPEYRGPPRLIVPTVRGNLEAGEPLRLTVLLLGGRLREAAIYWRPLGPGPFARVPLAHAARGVYSVSLSGEAVKADFEYYVEAVVAGKALTWPASAPGILQSVVVE